MQRHPVLNNKELLEKEYATKGVEQIASECGCSMFTVSERLEKFNIKRRGSGDQINRNNPKGKDHWRWKGGQYETKAGYIKALKPKGHPAKGRYILQSRHVLEKKLGRHLTSKEIAHHVDGNKRNNSPENIELIESQSEHARYHGEHRHLYPQIHNLKWMTEQYVENQKTLEEIADMAGCTDGAVRNALDRLGIDRRPYTTTESFLLSRRNGGLNRWARWISNPFSPVFIQEEVRLELVAA